MDEGFADALQSINQSIKYNLLVYSSLAAGYTNHAIKSDQNEILKIDIKSKYRETFSFDKSSCSGSCHTVG